MQKKLLDLKEEGERLRDLKLNAERRREEAESLIECKNKEIDEDETKRKQMETEIESLKRKKDDLDRKAKEILIELKLSETERKNLEKHHAESRRSSRREARDGRYFERPMSSRTR